MAQHSDVVDVVKATKEDIKDNYSSEKLVGALDTLINQCLRDIVNTSDYIQDVLVQILSWYVKTQRRRITHLTKDQFANYVTCYILEDNPKFRFKILRRLSFERMLLVKIIQDWLELGKEFQQEELAFIKHGDNVARLQYLKTRLKVRDLDKFSAAVTRVESTLQMALRLRSMIADKYMRLAVVEAVKYIKQYETSNGERLHLNDVTQNFVLAIYKAIDKCNITQGTLTAYVLRWLANARSTNQFRVETGLAYTVPAPYRKRLALDGGDSKNFALSLDHETVKLQQTDSLHTLTNELDQDKRVNDLRLLAKAADPYGLGRIRLGIKEIILD